METRHDTKLKLEVEVKCVGEIEGVVVLSRFSLLLFHKAFAN
jgi:hypothetical protein